jgi:hypothetical protein
LLHAQTQPNVGAFLRLAGLTAGKAKDYDPINTAGDEMAFNLEFTPAFSGTVSFRSGPVSHRSAVRDPSALVVLSGRYVFGSREMPSNFATIGYQDAFKLLLNDRNIATLSNMQEVSINNLGGQG